MPAFRKRTRAFAEFSTLDRYGRRGVPRAGLVYDRRLGALDCNVQRYVALLAPPSRQTDVLARLVNEHTPVLLCGRIFGVQTPEFHPQLVDVVRHLSASPALRGKDPIGYWSEVLSIVGEQPIGLILCRADAPALWDAVVADPNAIKIAFKATSS